LRLTKVAVSATVVVALVVGATMYLDHLNAEWNRRVEVVQAVVNEIVEENDSLRSESLTLREQADSALANVAPPDTVRMRVREIVEVPVPDTCAVFVIRRDSLINELVEDNEHLRVAYTAERKAADLLRIANDDLLVAIDSLNTVLDARPLPAPALAPRVGVGVFGGMCADGKPCVGVGVSINVKINPLDWIF
jgi:hypothetical protein